MRSSQLIIKSDAQKQMAKSSSGCKLHDLKYSKVGLYFISQVEFIINLRPPLQIFLKNINLMYSNHIYNKFETITYSISPTCTPLRPSSKICIGFS